MSDERKANAGGTGMVVAGLIAVFVGLWMVGQTMATEGDAIKLKLNQLAGDIETISFELKALKAQATSAHAAAAVAEAAPAEEPAAEPAAEPAEGGDEAAPAEGEAEEPAAE